jgi:hypothetical protein
MGSGACDHRLKRGYDTDCGKWNSPVLSSFGFRQRSVTEVLAPLKNMCFYRVEVCVGIVAVVVRLPR